MRLAWIISACGVLVLNVVFLARSQWVEAIYRLMLEGSIALLWLLSAAGLGATLLRAMGAKAESKALAFTTSAGLGLGIISLLTLGMGLGGVLNRGSALGLIIVGLCTGTIITRKVQFYLPQLDWLLLLLMPGLAIALVGAFVMPGVLWSDEPAGYDVMAYHFQVPREWYELGRIVPLEHNVFSYFPFNVEMHYLLAMHLRGGAYAGMYLAQVMHVVFVGLSVVAVMGAFENPRAKVLAALVMGSVPWLMMIAPMGYNEGGLLLFGTLAIVWTLRASIPSPDTPGNGQGEGSLMVAEKGPSPRSLPTYRERGWRMVIAGALAGFACGSKLTGIPILLIAIPVIGIILRRLPIKSALLFLIAGVLTFSPWLLRNQFWIGNPIFPEAATLLGRSHFTDDQIARWQDAHQPAIGPVDRATAVWDQLLANWRWGFTFLPLSLLAIPLSQHRSIVRFLAGLLLVYFIFWIGFTHVQSRFFILAAPIGALLIASIEALRWRIFATGGVLISAVVGWITLGRQIFTLPHALGLENFQVVMRASVLPSDVAAAIYDDRRPVILVGDAQAFMYSIPMSRLHYRSVFDVVEWIGPNIPADAQVILFPVELNRLKRYYTHLPPLPPEVEGRTEPFILQRRN